MFFLRPDYTYGNPTERPERLDEALAAELSQFLNEIPPKVSENINGDCNIFDHYKGPHSYLFILAVTYAVRAMADGNPRSVTKEMMLNAAANTKNWPTRGYLSPRITGDGFHEDRGLNDSN